MQSMELFQNEGRILYAHFKKKHMQFTIIEKFWDDKYRVEMNVLNFAAVCFLISISYIIILYLVNNLNLNIF